MKKILCIIAALTLCAAIPAKAFPCFGIKGGYNLSTVTIGGVPVIHSGQVGLFTGIDFPFKVGTRAEVLYSWQGGYIPTIGDRYAIYNSQYVKIPLTVRYNFKGFFAEAGVSFDMLTDSKLTSITNFQLTANDFDLSIPVGVGYQIPMGKLGTIDISARYYISTIPIFEELPDVRNSLFTVSIGISFGGIKGSKLASLYN